MDFSVRLKQVRMSRGLSQQTLGNMLGLSKQAIFNYESGANTPGHFTFIRLADELNVSLDFLTGRSNVMDTEVRKDEAAPLVQNILGMIEKLSDEGKAEVHGMVEKVLEREARYGNK